MSWAPTILLILGSSASKPGIHSDTDITRIHSDTNITRIHSDTDITRIHSDTDITKDTIRYRYNQGYNQIQI